MGLTSLSRALVIASIGVALLVGGCAETRDKVGDPVMPAKPDLSTPDSAVRSYIDWVSLSYRMANSEISTATMTPYEGVRVDSYIELNRQKDQGIDQKLLSFEKRSESREGTAAVLAASENWEYRYFSLSSLRYTSGVNRASYETTYTLERDGSAWKVSKVEAEALGEVK